MKSSNSRLAEKLLAPILGIVILGLSIYFLLPNILELYWLDVTGKIEALEKTTFAENSKYRGTVESSFISAAYSYVIEGKTYHGKDSLMGRSQFALGKAPAIQEEVGLIVNPQNFEQSMVRRPWMQLPVLGLLASVILLLGPLVAWLIRKFRN